MTNITTGGIYTTLPITNYGPATYTYPVSLSTYGASNNKAGDIYWHDIPEYCGDNFDLNGATWTRADIELRNELRLHYKRFIAICGTIDHGVIGNVVGGELRIHPAFSSQKTFDAFNSWWDRYVQIFSGLDLEHTLFPSIPCGGHSNIFITKSENPEEEFRKFYSALSGNVWYEAGKWFFANDTDAVMAKLRLGA